MADSFSPTRSAANSLGGDDEILMSRFEFTIEMDGSNNFTKVRYSGESYNIEEWNSLFIEGYDPGEEGVGSSAKTNKNE